MKIPALTLVLALRNLWKNRRRSAATLLAIATGFAAISLFNGYIANVYRGMANASIHGEGLGHLSIAKRGYFESGTLNPEQYQFRAAELDRLQTLLRATPGVKVVSPRLSASGLISNGRISTIFLAEGEAPSAASRIRGERGGPALREDQPDSALLSAGLASLLGAQPGADLVALTSTLAGQTNALDLTMLASWQTGTLATNDKSVRVPLVWLQRLLDTDGANRVTVLLDEGADASAARKTLAPRLAAAGFDLEIRTWVELSNFYRQVKNMFDLIFLFLFSIVFIVVLMSIINTLTMSVMERVREIGTLRALGMQGSGVLRIFATEGAMLGLAGCLAGAALAALGSLLINTAKLSYVPPASSNPVSLSISLQPGTMLFTLLILALVSTLAACVPARRAARIEIVDALGHV